MTFKLITEKIKNNESLKINMISLTCTSFKNFCFYKFRSKELNPLDAR